MGSGKTTWGIQKLNTESFTNFLYITPFLNEVDRIIKNTNRNFKQPTYKGKRKLDNLNDLLACQEDVASTHALFKQMDGESREHIRNGKYTLILDEVLDVIGPYDDIKNDDIKLLVESNCVTIDKEGFLIWNKDKLKYDTKYNEIKTMAENRSLLYVNQKLLLWKYPPDIFNLFDRIYILTYLFDASILKNYFDLYDIQYTVKSVKEDNGRYQLVDYFVPDTSMFKSLINIYDGKLNNNFFQKKTGLSKTWFSSNNNKAQIIQLRKNLYNYFSNITNAKAETIMWSTFKDYKNKLRGKGYSSKFVTYNCRSTNDYDERFNLAYCINIYVHVATSQFFLQHNIQIDEDLYALSEMIQWIWRSRIRNGEDINLYLPSIRMRNLLNNWIDMNLIYQNKKVS